jgi:predicted nucleotidyltransferase
MLLASTLVALYPDGREENRPTNAVLLTARQPRTDVVKGQNTRRQIQQMVRRIVQAFDPDGIILFGSHARGQGGPDSNVDLLVVMPVKGSKRAKQLEVRIALHDIHVPKDIIIS